MNATLAAPVVEMRGLVKRYGGLVAVDHIDLTVDAGEIYGYLGPNGAGKTTSMRMLLGLITPDEGSVRLFGRDPFDDVVSALQGVAGFVETPRFYPYMSARKNLEWCAAIDGGDARQRIPSALDRVDLADRAADRVGNFSFGMKQRLGIAAALLRDPQLLILDEPTTGLDPAGQRDMRVLVRRLADEGLTVFLSSHVLAEVEDLCSRVAIIRSGSIAYEGTIEELKVTRGGSYRLETSDNQAAGTVLEQLGFPFERREGVLHLHADPAQLDRLFYALAEARLPLRALVPDSSASLESLFFDLTEEQP